MAFLDNSCDIILDAVLTDHGRKVLAKGDGSFQITKFALGDEEIDYSTFNKTHSSGSAYYDLEILQTPILEAITDNATSMKTKLVTYENPNLLHLPVLQLNEKDNITKRHTTGKFLVATDRNTEGTSDTCTDKAIGYDTTGTAKTGVIHGASLTEGGFIRIDQGLQTTEITARQRLDPALIEDSYMLIMDNRFGSPTTINGTRIAPDFVDDDNIAFYTVTRADGMISDNTDTTNSLSQVIQGPRGTRLEFKIRTSIHLNTSTFLYDQLGSTTTAITNKGGSAASVRIINTLIKVRGMKTGFSIDVPVAYVQAIN